ncbi:MAG: UDP-N-acetylmuramate dehydrogenase [Saprospiraceae bacterium]|nr:UDP-N-acetylmuramate dehydrogenase [Saprospiraceae bacterium]
MIWESNKDLRNHNTFGVSAKCAYFTTVHSVAEVETAVREAPAPILLLGGGSNVLFTGDLPAAVLHMALPGIHIVQETSDQVHVAVGGGVRWHDLVLWAVSHGYGGIENLALIPGNAGAAPIQNIGAYGVEVASVIEAVEAYDLQNKEVLRFPSEVCEFGYRTSVFKTDYRNKLLILRLHLRLNKHPVLHLEYGAIRDELSYMGIAHPDVRSVSQAVIRIRQSKLPDPAKLGNAGSFFKNPVVSRAVYEDLLSKYPAMPHYPVDDSQVKIPAAWLIDQLGWKGHRQGDAGVHHRHALVLVNYGTATGQQLIELSSSIRHSVHERFGIVLETEVNIVG